MNTKNQSESSKTAYRLAFGGVLLLLGIVCSASCLSWRKSESEVERDARMLASRVLEPIEFVDATTSNFDGTYYFTFRDAKKVVCIIELESGATEHEIGKDSVVFTYDGITRKMEKSGEAEKLLINILEHWSLSDLDAKKITMPEFLHWELEGKDVGVAILRQLKLRAK
jgi:hypothetical protein